MPPKPAHRLAALATLAVLLLHAAPAAAAEPPTVEPRATEILNAALKHIAGAPSLTLRAEVVSETVLPSGMKLQYPGTLEVTLRRPDRLLYRLDSEQHRVASWYDGKVFTLLDSDKNVCASTAVPKGLGPLFDDMAARLGFRPPLSALLREDNVGAFTRGIESGFYVGRGVVGGTACHHLAFRQQNVDLQLWVAEEGAPLVKRIVITRKNLAAMPQRAYTVTAWDFGADIADAVFNFEPPPNVVRCEFQELLK